MGIPTGSTLVSSAGDVEVTVVAPRKVQFGGEETSLTAVTRTMLGLPYSVAPGPYWRFQGKLLSEIYEDTYPQDGDG
jgi:hypothetical protein